MRRVVVLGAGRVGSLIAADLASDAGFDVTLADFAEDALGRAAASADLATVRADLSSGAEVERVVADADAVVGAVPGRIGLGVLGAAVRAGKPVADISFTPEDPGVLDAEARRRGVPVVVDIGVAPGLSNLLVGRAVAELETTSSVRILVGGLPERRVWPWEYRSVFSPTDVIEEYTRPARIRAGGVEVVRSPLSERELVDLPGVGTLEAFLTDGLRTLLRTIDAPNLIEKTLRWPGHAEKMAALRDSGFFDDGEIDVGGVRVAPRAMTEHLLFRSWEPAAGDTEFTVLRVEVEGRRAAKGVRITWDLLDRTDGETGATSMSRTTGFPCALVARMLAERTWAEPGVHPPEILGRDARVTAAILEGLSSRGVRVTRSECTLDG